MDLYTLTDQFLADKVVDEFISAIWTERYSGAGDVQLVLPATADNLEKLKDGTFLALRGTKEVMELETQNIEDNTLTVVGSTLDEFLDERIAWFKNPDWTSGEPTDPKVVDYTDVSTAGEFLADAVDLMVIDPIPMTGADFDTEVNLDWDFEKIPHLELGAVDTSGDTKRLTLPIGPLYQGLKGVAEQENIGFSLYLDSADAEVGYVLKFSTYRGVDRTSDGTHPLVRLAPDMDSLSDLKEIRSRANWKNVVYVWYKNEVSLHYEDPTAPKPEGFARRVLVTDAEGEPVGRKVIFGGFGGRGFYGGGWSQIVVGPGEIAAFREQNAKDALANHNYIRALDGQVSPHNDYKFGTDYGLGDLIELQSLTGTISKARITEYIRSQDKTGEREYPTISVVN